MSNSSSPPETSFTPRPEFRREHKQPNTFSLLALAGSNCIRLYSFPLPVILHLRRFLDQASLVAAYREDVPNNFCEFALQGKPWASPKSVATEGLLLELMGVVYHHGYTYLSTLDYGRETDDRLAIAFSKPSVRSDSPASPDYSKSSFTERPSKGSRVPFALSFPSSTLLRVICPPLDSTPAILQAVRGSWPRGVVSEKKVGDSTFEFKLKGYKWFQQDTFATDSLRHILSLLSSLDSHSFTLLASISLTNSRSRVKDLWLFTSPTRSSADIAYPDSPASSVNASQADLKRNVHSPELPPYQTSPTHQSHQHRRLATEPVPQTPSPLQHVRATTEDPTSHPSNSLRKATPSPTPSHTLRKPAPRAQLPVSVHEDGVEPQSYRTQLPSTIPSGIENMTGVGAGVPTPDVFYSTSPFHGSPQEPTYNRAPNATEQFPPPAPTPKIQYCDTTHQEDASPSPQFQLNPSSSSEPNTPPLLGPGVFRDSAFSTSSEMSAEIPIKWTGVITDPVTEAVESTPDFPGGWQPTPVEEKPDETSALNVNLDQGTRPEQPIQAVVERVASPTLSDGEGPRKSEAGLIGMVTSSVDKGKGREIDEAQKETTMSGQAGWVLVNVEGSIPAEMTASPVQEKQLQSQDSLKQPAGSSSGSGSSAVGMEKPVTHAAPTSSSASMSPVAKAIVIVDPVDAKNKKSQTESASRIRRLFSLSRKDSKKFIDKRAKHKKTRSNVEVRSASIPETPED